MKERRKVLPLHTGYSRSLLQRHMIGKILFNVLLDPLQPSVILECAFSDLIRVEHPSLPQESVQASGDAMVATFLSAREEDECLTSKWTSETRREGIDRLQRLKQSVALVEEPRFSWRAMNPAMRS